uniref:Uncharacterized protein n=1 Tax=Fagus sylvatica TaxID=28930 RepID=A0A2N9GXE0_FAGSY
MCWAIEANHRDHAVVIDNDGDCNGDSLESPSPAPGAIDYEDQMCRVIEANHRNHAMVIDNDDDCNGGDGEELYIPALTVGLGGRATALWTNPTKTHLPLFSQAKANVEGLSSWNPSCDPDESSATTSQSLGEEQGQGEAGFT